MNQEFGTVNHAASFNEDEVREILKQCESRRLKTLLIMAPLLSLVLGGLLCALLCMPQDDPNIPVTFVISVLLCMPPSFRFARFLLSGIYKGTVLPYILKSVNPSLQFGASGPASPDLAMFAQSRLFRQHPNVTFTTEDKISGVAGQVPVTLCEAHYSIDGEGKDTFLVKLFKLCFLWADLLSRLLFHKRLFSAGESFHGLVFTAAFNKRLQNLTLVTSDKYPSIPVDGLKTVSLDSIDFNKVFHIYTDNETEAFYVFDPMIQENLLAIARQMKDTLGRQDIRISFVDDRLLVLFPDTKDHFEGNLYTPLTMKRVKRDRDIISALLTIVDAMNINRHIWAK